jgi:hypothetical protein
MEMHPMAEFEDGLQQLRMESAAHGTAAVLLATHILIALLQRDVFSPADAVALMDAATASALGLDGNDESRRATPNAYVQLVVASLDRMRGLLPPPLGTSH